MGLFGGGKNQASASVPFSEYKINRSSYGLVIPAIYGRSRNAGFAIWAGDFTAHKQQKGGKGGPSGSGDFYTYTMSLQVGHCYGPITGFGRAWNMKSTGLKRLTNVQFSGSHYTARGDYGQVPWPYLTSKHPAFDLAYSGIAWHASANFNLGTSSMPSPGTVEIFGLVAGGVSSTGDAYVDQVIRDVISNFNYGAVPGATWVDVFADYRNYCIANGLFLSPVMDTQKPASDWIKDLLEITNSDAYFSNGMFKIQTLGDTAVTGNGVTWEPNLAPIYSFSDNDFIADSNQDPLIIDQSNPANRSNTVQVEYTNAANDFNLDVVEAKDESQILTYGLRRDQPRSYHPITTPLVAKFVAHIKLQRALFVNNTYTVSVSGRYFLLDPMDVIGLLDPMLGDAVYPVRINTIEEDDKHELKITAEDLGPNFTPAYPTSPTAGWIHPDGNVEPQSVNPPIIFEPGRLLPAGAFELWIALSGSNAGGQAGAMDYGGNNVWYSEDGLSYSWLGTQKNSAQTGYLLADLPATDDPDTTDTLQIDLSESGGLVSSISTAQADAGYGLAYVDGELISFATVNLGPDLYQYDLSYLRRGFAGTQIADHAVGSAFAFLNSVDYLDPGIFRWPYRPDLVGSTVYFKFTSLNSLIDAEEDLASVTAYPYTIGGTSRQPIYSAVVWGQIKGTNPGLGFTIQPTGARANGAYLYIAVRASGVTGSTEPTWPIRQGLTVKDGGMTWQCLGQASSLQPGTVNGVAIATLPAPLPIWGGAAPRQLNTAYHVGQIRFAPTILYNLECTGRGTSSGAALSGTYNAGDTINDGGVTWLVLGGGSSRTTYGVFSNVLTVNNAVASPSDLVMVELFADVAIDQQSVNDHLWIRLMIDGVEYHRKIRAVNIAGGLQGKATEISYKWNLQNISAGSHSFAVDFMLVSDGGAFVLAVAAAELTVIDVQK